MSVRKWTEQDVIADIQKVQEVLNVDYMPSRRQMKKVVGNDSLYSRIRISGGSKHYAEIMDIDMYRKYIINSGHRLFNIYDLMISRCYDPKNKSYPYYGGRGIRVCEEWRENKNAFFEWAVRNGYSDDLSIDRIDNNGNYCPENCRWATQIEQANNKSSNRFLTLNGETHTVCEWSRIIGIDNRALRTRIDVLGWSVEKALTEPNKRRCAIIDLDTGEQYESMSELAEILGCNTSAISRVCSGERKTYKGHRYAKL